MKSKIIGVGIVAIVVVAAIAVVFYGTEGSPYWETETEFGIWEETILIEFADGSTKSLKLIQEGQDRPFSVRYDNKIIKRIGLEIKASATGTGYTGATLKYENNFGVKRSVSGMSYNVLYTGISTRPDGSTQNIPLDTTAPILTTWLNIESLTNSNPHTYPTASYRVKFEPQGQVQYKGYPDGGSYVTVGLPSTRSAIVSVVQTPTANIIVTLGSDITSD